MRKTITMAVLLLALAACNQNSKTTDNNNINMNQKEKAKEVAGRRNFGAQHPVMTPQPCIMIATYDENQVPDVMMAAWGGQCDYDKITFDLGAHKTTDNIRLKKAFTVSFATEENMAESDYFGLVSGNKIPDKVKRAGFIATPSPNVDAPIINEYKLTLECRVIEMEENGEGGARVVGEVVNWSADESILNAEGKVDLAKLKPIIFDSSALVYRTVGDSIGQAWHSGKKFQ
ncbi:flavin reductase family protein [Parabacteroides bouchesdurhonensis]|uniref:flavin reductase family protein n=1 Tax=Parabacteroides bouchesdurhonensis TaxID=1936995 RepID=UPI001F310E27|nr:flavin reductase [Parabacteroides bouchesdurhonensis]